MSTRTLHPRGAPGEHDLLPGERGNERPGPVLRSGHHDHAEFGLRRHDQRRHQRDLCGAIQGTRLPGSSPQEPAAPTRSARSISSSRPQGVGTFGFIPDAPEGSQALFLSDTGSVSQSINFTTTGTFALQFMAAAMDGKEDSVDFYFDGNLITPQTHDPAAIFRPPHPFFAGQAWGTQLSLLRHIWNRPLSGHDDRDAYDQDRGARHRGQLPVPR